MTSPRLVMSAQLAVEAWHKAGAGPYGRKLWRCANCVWFKEARPKHYYGCVWRRPMLLKPRWKDLPGRQTVAVQTLRRCVVKCANKQLGGCVTNERHVLAIGAGGGARKVQFSDQETSALGQRLQPSAGQLRYKLVARY